MECPCSCITKLLPTKGKVKSLETVTVCHNKQHLWHFKNTISSYSFFNSCTFLRYPSLLYLGIPFGRGKVGGCSPSRLPGADGGVSRALWCEEVSSSGSTVWQAWSFKWNRWPQYRNLWETVSTLEKAERSANVTAHCRMREHVIQWWEKNMAREWLPQSCTPLWNNRIASSIFCLSILMN